jgi:hypothetical protein
MSTTGIPLQSAQNPAPDEDMLAMLGLHPAQMAVAHGIASGAIHPQDVLDAATPQPAPPLQAAENPEVSIPGAAPSIAPPPSATSSLDSRPAPDSPAPIAPPPVLSGQSASPRIAPPLNENITPPTRLSADQSELGRLDSTGSGLQQFQQRHPILGTIARIGAGVGSAMFPGIAANIPGTDLHHQVLVNEARGRVGEDLGEQEKQAQIGEAQSRTPLIQAQTREANANADNAEQGGKATKPEPIFDKAGNIVGFNTGTDLLSLKSPALTPEMHAIAEAAKPKPAAGESQEQNKLGYQGIIGKLDAAKLPTDPKSIDKSLDKALAQKVITPEEHAAARSYEAANQTPGTNLTVHVAGQEEGNKLAIDKMFEGSEVLAHLPDGRRVQMSYADAKAQNIPPERLIKLGAKEAQDTRDKAASVDTTFKGLDRYRTDFKTTAPQLTDKDRDALRVLAAHNQSGATGGLIAGFIDELPLAGPISSYVNKLAEGTMTSDQYKQLSPPGKKLVSDYFTSIIDNFANMKAVMGTVGRNPQMLQAEVNTIPVPYLDWESAAIQFDNKRASLQGRAASMPELYTPKTK